MTRTTNQTIGDGGEDLVKEELERLVNEKLKRRGYKVKRMPPNEAIEDVIVYCKGRKEISIQVKTTECIPKKDGHNVWRFGKARKKILEYPTELLDNLFYIFVSLNSNNSDKRFLTSKAVDIRNETEKYSLEKMKRKENSRKSFERFDSRRFEKRGYKFTSWDEMLE